MNSIKELIIKIKERPVLFLGRKSITSLRSFLHGWCFRNYDGIEDAELMSDFQDWIANKYKIITDHSWSDILLFYSVDENAALDLFFKEFDLFLLDEKNNVE